MNQARDHWFQLLGPPEARARGRALALGGSKQRTLLAALLLDANRVVPVDRLIDVVWDEAPPATVVAQLQAQVSALRAALASGGAGRPVLTRPGGYLLSVEPGELDLDAFVQRSGRARRALAEGRAGDAAGAFGSALALWRGLALGGLESRYVRAEADRLEELRLGALEGGRRVPAEPGGRDGGRRSGGDGRSARARAAGPQARGERRVARPTARPGAPGARASPIPPSRRRRTARRRPGRSRR